MNKAAIITAAKQFGAVPIAAEDKARVQTLIDEGVLEEPITLYLVGQWSLWPHFEESAWVYEARIRQDWMDTEWYSGENTWQHVDWMGNPDTEAETDIETALMNLSADRFDPEYEVRIRRVGTEHSYLIVTGEPEEEAQAD